jgi:hypothetical protein
MGLSGMRAQAIRICWYLPWTIVIFIMWTRCSVVSSQTEKNKKQGTSHRAAKIIGGFGGVNSLPSLGPLILGVWWQHTASLPPLQARILGPVWRHYVLCTWARKQTINMPATPQVAPLEQSSRERNGMRFDPL